MDRRKFKAFRSSRGVCFSHETEKGSRVAGLLLELNAEERKGLFSDAGRGPAKEKISGLISD